MYSYVRGDVLGDELIQLWQLRSPTAGPLQAGDSGMLIGWLSPEASEAGKPIVLLTVQSQKA